MHANRGLVAMVLVAVALVAVTGCGRARAHRSDSTGTTRTTGSSGPTTVPASTTTSTTSSSVRPAVDPVGRMVDGSITTADGRARTYHLYVPSSLPEGEVPLLVALHGGFGNGMQFRDNSGFDGLAEANGFLVVFPDGTPIPALPKGRVWNAGGCCGAAAEGRDAVDDVGFISALIDEIAADHPVDPDRVFAAGHSNGAMMSYRLACELSDEIAAIGVQSGALFTAPCSPQHPVSVLHIHGSADDNVPLAGGRGGRSLAGVDFPVPHLGVEAFARFDDCPDEPERTTDPDNADLAVETWTPCDSGTEVRFVTVAGANHAWMGHAPNGTLSRTLVGDPYPDYDSSLAIWTFLAAHPRR